MFNQKRFHLNFPKSRGDYFIFSLPQSNHYQTITNLSITPAGCESHMINNHNRIARTLIINLNDVINNISIRFNALLKPVKVVIDSNFEIEDYNSLDFKELVRPNHFINGKDKNIKALAEENIKDSANVLEIVSSLYNFSLQYLNYGKPTTKLYTYKQALMEKTTDCGGFSTFLASLLQSVGIPTRLVVGFLVKNKSIFDFCLPRDLSLESRLWREKWEALAKWGSLSFDSLIMHTWLEILLPNKIWLPLDPSVEWRRIHHQSQRRGGFGDLPADID